MTAQEYIDEGTAAVALGDFDQAIDYLRKAAGLEPSNFDAWHSLGMAYMKAGRYPEAVEAGKKAVELSPNDQFARVSLSMYFQRNSQIPEAEAEAAKAKILGWGGKLIDNKPGEKLSGE
jgi:Flp pilus assembly protein TadD